MKYQTVLLSTVLAAEVTACATTPVPIAPVPVAAEQAAASEPSADARLDALAERMIAVQVAYDPTSAYFIGVPPPDNRRWPDHGLDALAAVRAQNDALLDELGRIRPEQLSQPKRFIHASMVERLEADRQARACKYELWNVNHLSGWHLDFADVAREQPVETPEQRADALQRWADLPKVVDAEIANARTGLQSGYSAPRSVVARVIKQVDAMVAAEPESLPYWQVAERSSDAAFKAEMRTVIAGPIRESFRRFRQFLADEYLPKAREALAITANPNGRACYEASLRAYTTLQRSPEGVFELGQRTVSGNLSAVQELGRRKFGTDVIPAIVERIKDAPDNRFKSEEELIAFSRAVVDKARTKSAGLFMEMPAQEMRVEPFHAYRRGSGGSSYYERQIDPAQPAFYRIASEKWEGETRGGAEITAVHEGYPGHHMQISLATANSSGPIMNMLGNSAYAEGWARYSEALAEEAGIYATDYALMTRRLWPARGMVVDPALHLMGWTPEQVIAFVRESGRFGGEDAIDLVDRIAVWPGQLTAYDSGALEIFALRREAEQALGDRFDVREFHDRVLETGIVPLWALRRHIEEWIATKQAARP